MLFLLRGNAYAADSLSLSVSTGSGFRGWTLVRGYLEMESLELSLNATNLSSNRTRLYAALSAWLDYTSRDEVPLGHKTPLSLTVDRQIVSFNINFGGCSFMDIIFIATSGRFNVPGSWWPEMQYLNMTFDWSYGRGTFNAVFNDVGLPWCKTIARMSKPTLYLQVQRPSGLTQFSAKGTLSGTAKVFGISIPISYDLPKGMSPFDPTDGISLPE